MNSDPSLNPVDISGLFIRRMIHADLEQVIAIDQASFSLPWPQRSFQYELDENFVSRCWVAELEGHVVAMMVGWMMMDEMHIATIATHPKYRQLGIGKKILIHALSKARDNEGLIRAFLEVREHNLVALNMYRGMGFVEEGRRKEYYKDNNEDAILMTLNDLGHLQGE